MNALLMVVLAATALGGNAPQPLAAPTATETQAVPPWRRPAPPPAPPEPSIAPAAPPVQGGGADQEPKAPEWYRPLPHDALLPWNTHSTWRSPLTVIALEYSSHSTQFPEEKSLSGNQSLISPAMTADRSITALRVRWSFISWMFGQGSAKLTFDGGGSVRVSVNALETAFHPGQMVLHDFGLPDIQLGISYPEPYVGVAWGSSTEGGVDTTCVFPSLGVRVVGARATFADLGFAELMVGRISYDFALFTEKDPATGETRDFPTQGKLSFGLAPTLRIGIVF